MFAGFGDVEEVVLLGPGGEAQPGGAAGVEGMRQALLTFKVPPVLGEGGGGVGVGVESLKKIVDVVVSSMNSQDFGGVPMHLARAPFELVAAHLPALASVGPEPTPLVELRELLVVDGVTRFDDAEEMEELRLEIFQECSKSGVLEKLVIPAPASSAPRGTPVPVFAAFTTVAGAVACAEAMKTKLFDGRVVVTRFLSPDEWRARGGGHEER